MAGGVLESHGGVVDEAFLELLASEEKEVLREGEVGDMMVSIEDRLINASLAAITGKDKPSIEKLFRFFAVFPEDVPVPAAVFDVLADRLAGADVKRPQLKVRSWLTSLVRCNLVRGSIQRYALLLRHTLDAPTIIY